MRRRIEDKAVAGVGGTTVVDPRARPSLSCTSTAFVSTALSAIVASSKTASSLGMPRCFAIASAMAPAPMLILSETSSWTEREVRMWRLERRPARREEEEVGRWERRRRRAVQRSEE